MARGEARDSIGIEALGAVGLEGTARREGFARMGRDGEGRWARVGGGGGGGRQVELGAPPDGPLLLVGILVASESLGLEELLVAEEAREEPHIPRVTARR